MHRRLRQLYLEALIKLTAEHAEIAELFTRLARLLRVRDLSGSIIGPHTMMFIWETMVSPRDVSPSIFTFPD